MLQFFNKYQAGMNTNKHMQQVFWQIYLPIILIFGILAFFIYSFFGKSVFGELNLRIWSDISILVITFPLMISIVLSFIFLFIMIYLVSRSRSVISNAFLRISNISSQISGWTAKLANYITHPVIQIESLFSQLLSHKKE